MATAKVGVKDLPITPEAVAAEEALHQWRKLTNKIAQRGVKGLTEVELGQYERMRKERGMTTVGDAAQEVNEEMGTTAENIAAVKEQEAGEGGTERPPCLCGCGEFPKSKTAKFMPGHDARYHAAEKRRVDAEKKAAEMAATPEG